MAVTIMVVLTMMYGFYKWKTDKYDQKTSIDRIFEVLTVVVAIFMIVRFIWLGIYDIGKIMEVIIVIAEISGTLLLARKNILGWYSYILMSLLVGTLVIFVNSKSAIVLGILELSSVYFYNIGIKNMNKKEFLIL